MPLKSRIIVSLQIMRISQNIHPLNSDHVDMYKPLFIYFTPTFKCVQQNFANINIYNFSSWSTPFMLLLVEIKLPQNIPWVMSDKGWFTVYASLVNKSLWFYRPDILIWYSRQRKRFCRIVVSTHVPRIASKVKTTVTIEIGW